MVEAGEQPASNRVLRVRLQTTSKAILLYSASDIEMLTAEQEANHPFLLRVGPDVLDMTLTAEQVKARLLSAKFRNRQFSGLLLDQAFLAGLGNYLRVEILWQVGLTGGHKASELNETQLDALAHALLDIPRLSYRTRGQPDNNKHPSPWLLPFLILSVSSIGPTCWQEMAASEVSSASPRPPLIPPVFARLI